VLAGVQPDDLPVARGLVVHPGGQFGTAIVVLTAVHDQQRCLGEQRRPAERVEGQQGVQGPARHPVLPGRGGGTGGAVVGPRLVAGHRGRAAARRHGRQEVVVGVDEAPEPGAVAGRIAGEPGRAVVGAGDPGDRAHPRIGGGGADRVPAAQTDAHQADPFRVHFGPRPQQAHRRPQVGELALGVLVTAAPRAGAETTMIEGERDQARTRQPVGIPAGDLLADAGEGPGQRDRAAVRAGRDAQGAAQGETLAGEADLFGSDVVHTATLGSAQVAAKKALRGAHPARGDDDDAGDPGRARGGLRDAAGTRTPRGEVAGPADLRAAGRAAAPGGAAAQAAGHHAEGAHRDAARDGRGRPGGAAGPEGGTAAARRVRPHPAGPDPGRTTGRDLRLGAGADHRLSPARFFCWPGSLACPVLLLARFFCWPGSLSGLARQFLLGLVQQFDELGGVHVGSVGRGAGLVAPGLVEAAEVDGVEADLVDEPQHDGLGPLVVAGHRKRPPALGARRAAPVQQLLGDDVVEDLHNRVGREVAPDCHRCARRR
jgi:hypothetical protein